MMDYEFRIELLEKDLAHYRAMQALLRAHVDAHDDHLANANKAFGANSSRLDRIEEGVEKLVLAQAVTEVRMQETQDALKSLIAAIARDHTNGSASKPKESL